MSDEGSQVVVVREEHLPGLMRLFENADNPCFCQYWQFTGDSRDWQIQCANDPEKNREALKRQVVAGELMGLVALHGGHVVGWARLESPEKLHKLYQGRLYRGLPCFSGDRSRVLTVACFLVDPSWRRRGVAKHLLSVMKTHAARLGARHLEAFPRTATDVPDEQHWLGPPDLLAGRGFEVVHDFAPYPVMRISLDSPDFSSESAKPPQR